MFKKLVVNIAGLFLSVQAAQAGLVVDVVEQHERVGWFDTYTYSHDLSDTGFVLGTAVSGLLDVEIHDDRDSNSWIWRLELSGLRVDGSWVDFTAGNSFDDVAISGQALASVNSNGILDIAVKSFWGDFFVGDSTLSLTTLDGPVASSTNNLVVVPEPGVIILLGAGLLGLGVARKRQS